MSYRLFACLSIAAILTVRAPSQSVAAKPAAAKAQRAPGVPRMPDGKPKFEGVWSFATLTPLERPAEFAGKATLTDKEAAEFVKQTVNRNNRDKRDGGADADVARAYNESWFDRGERASNQTSLIIDPPDGKLPPLTPAGQKRQAALQTARTRPAHGPEDRSLGERCILGFNAGPPMMPAAYNNNVMILQTRDSVALVTEMVHNTRIVPLDGRPHGSTRQWVGDSRGRWEGNTLVIDTINFTDTGTGIRVPTDENYHLTERLTLRDANTLIYEFTVDDPTMQTKPWTASVPMIRAKEPIYEYACHEGNYGMYGILQGARAEEKEAAEKK